MIRFIKMLPIYFTVIYLTAIVDALSLETVRAQNVTKRSTNVGDLFPDWVPFKNKHGEELGEFVQVPKRKPKKRLAQPAHYVLKAVAEPDNDDYYEKGPGGETDSDDYYEKKDWSDVYREPNKNNNQNHTEISEIDGVVSIIVSNKKPHNSKTNSLKKKRIYADASREEKDKKLTEKMYTEVDNQKLPLKSGPQKENHVHKYEDDVEYEDGNTEKRHSDPAEEDSSDTIQTKVSILDSVDDLKERHADEQRLINEKIKEEEIYKEEREREKLQARLSNAEPDKYDDHNRQKPKKSTSADYEEYEDKDSATDEKYVINMETSQASSSTTTPVPKINITKSKEKHIETGKLSVFKNPQLYIVYDDEFDESTTTVEPTYAVNKSQAKKKKYSAKITSPSSNKDDNERISLVPDENDGKEGEPTLFFPKKRKNKKRKNKFTQPMPLDSSAAASMDQKSTNPVITTTAVDDSASTAKPNAVSSTPSDASVNTEQVTDAVAASTDHKKKEKKQEDFEEERGGGKEYHSAHEEDHVEEGKKAYEGVHKETKNSKGHIDKEDHSSKYDDSAGVDKHHDEESGHYGSHHHEENGKKHAKYEETGKHSKGHNTKGSHDIHKKEEYEKKVEFFEEDGDSSEEEKHGGFNHEYGHDKAEHFKGSNYKAGNEEHVKGDSGSFAKGGHVHVSKGHKEAGGHDGHGKSGQSNGEKMVRDSGKKWIYHHGSPAKTSNLVRIDRRAEHYYHGPQYYG